MAFPTLAKGSTFASFCVVGLLLVANVSEHMSEEETAGAGAQFDIAQGGSGIGLSSSKDSHFQSMLDELSAIGAAPSSAENSGVRSSQEAARKTANRAHNTASSRPETRSG
ncbi:hypothetical protein AC579_2976 [Pseudocercospora musae]|uniref:Uncharacterized protein n=1 Tax=Pseudocercospora musae TaxID=113226 RepID=A0A139I7R2_9PEZI|nr:hypothetical protein AC579_2976 [Pseudocercospora musae]